MSAAGGYTDEPGADTGHYSTDTAGGAAYWSKAVGAVVVAVLTALVSAFTDGQFTAPEVVMVAGVFVAAIGVSIVPNLDRGVGAAAKSIVTFLVTGLTAVQVLMAGGLTLAEILEAIIAAAASVGVVASVRTSAPRAQLPPY